MPNKVNAFSLKNKSSQQQQTNTCTCLIYKYDRSPHYPKQCCCCKWSEWNRTKDISSASPISGVETFLRDKWSGDFFFEMVTFNSYHIGTAKRMAF